MKTYICTFKYFLAVELVWYSWLGNKKAVWSGPLPSRLSLLPPIGPRQSLFPFTKYVHSFLTSPYVEYSPTDKNMTRAISLSCHKIFQLPSQYVFAHVYTALELFKKTILCSRHIFALSLLCFANWSTTRLHFCKEKKWIVFNFSPFTNSPTPSFLIHFQLFILSTFRGLFLKLFAFAKLTSVAGAAIGGNQFNLFGKFSNKFEHSPTRSSSGSQLD